MRGEMDEQQPISIEAEAETETETEMAKTVHGQYESDDERGWQRGERVNK